MRIKSSSLYGLEAILKCGKEHFSEDGQNKFAVIVKDLGLLETLNQLHIPSEEEDFTEQINRIKDMCNEENDLGDQFD